MLNEESGKLGVHVIAETRERESFNGEFNGADSRRTSDKSVGSSDIKNQIFLFPPLIYMKIHLAPKLLFFFLTSHPTIYIIDLSHTLSTLS